MNSDERFKKLGIWLNQNKFSHKRYSLATEIREFLKHTIIDTGTEIEIGLDPFTADIVLKPVINGEEFLVFVGYAGPGDKKPPKRKRKVKS
jgi:hypothetical protein